MNEKSPMEVQDKRTENLISVNNILSFILIGVMSWVGINIEVMKDKMSEANTTNGIQNTKLDSLERRVTSLERTRSSLHYNYPSENGKPQ